MRRVIEWFAVNHVAANLVMALLLVGGTAALFTIPIRAFPDIDVPLVSIGVSYRGAAPEEIEEGICVRIEEEIDGVEGIERVTSSATEGACGVTAELIQGVDADRVLSDIKNRVDGITTFPEGADKPIVSQPTLRRAVIDLALSGSIGERSLKEIGKQIRDEISQLAGITQVELTNVRPYEISIEVPEEALRRHGLTFDQVVRAVDRSSLDMPGGSLKTEGGEILLRSKGQAYVGREFEELALLSDKDGTRVTLGDVARVVDGFEDSDKSAFFDGKPSVVVRVFRVGEQDALEVASTVKKFVAEKNAQLPDGVTLTVWRDTTELIKGRIDILMRNGRMGFLLVLLILALFLRARLAFWVALGIPISFAGALFTFPWFGLSIDMISLFSFILVLGILVDDAVVVGESVHTHQGRTDDPIKAAVDGTLEVSIPVIFGVLTSVMAFTPMLLVPGTMGQIFWGIAFVVILCLVFSLIESQLVLPSHLAHGSGTEPAKPGPWARLQQRCAAGLEHFIQVPYARFLERALEWRYTTLASGIAAFLVMLGLVAGNRLPFTFFPPVEADFITAQITMPTGAPVEVTEQAARQLVDALRDVQRELDPVYAPEGRSLVRHVLAAIGEQAGARAHGPPGDAARTSASHLAEVTVELIPGEEREIGTAAVAQRWRELTGPVPDAIELTFASSMFSAGNDIDIQLQGPDVAHLREAADRIKEQLGAYPGVYDVADSFRSGKREVKLKILPSAEILGVTLRDLARQVRQAFYGEEAQRIQRGRDDVRVMVRYPKHQRRSLGDLEDMRIRTDSGSEVPFGIVAQAETGRGFSTIKRAERQRVVNVTAAIDRSQITSDEVVGNLRKATLAQILSDYPGMSYSLQGQQREQARAVGGLIRGYLLALFGVYALLAIPLRSYSQPLIVMAVIPFGMIGAISGHLIMFIPNLSFMSILGVVALSGVVVN
ncbi:MAG: efflux RND transporter permease subunit, partial [Deltaproteobacteria bacterium]|nr:efflux RND transporter permease subunit [Deltaproteobacteria bacterium]